MKIWFEWVAHKKDSAEKSHLWGILYREDANSKKKKYICWGAVNARAYLIEPIHYIGSFERKQQKLEKGYKQITHDKVLRNWPNFMNDIEMQFIVEKLTK